MEEDYELNQLDDDKVELTMSDIEDNLTIDENRTKTAKKRFVITKIIYIFFTIVFACVLGSFRYLLPMQSKFENISTTFNDYKTTFIMQNISQKTFFLS